MEGLRVDITRRMRARANRVGQERQDFHDERGTANSYGLKGDADHWLRINIQGAMAELVVAHAVGTEDRWVECVENYHDLKGDVVDHLQVRSTYNPNNGLILHPKDADRDCFVLVYLDRDHDYAVLRGWLWAHEGKQEKWWPGKHPERPCFTVPPEELRPWPAPVWRGDVIYARDPEDQIARKRAKTRCSKRKREAHHTVSCPRCGWWTDHLVMPYYDSPWRFYGGLCGECCAEAERHYNKKGEWPAEPSSPPVHQDDLVADAERIFGLVEDKPEKRKKGEPDPNQTVMGFDAPAPPEE